MRFQVDRDVFADAVTWTARALPARPAVPVLAGMRLQADRQLTLSTFDYEVSALADVPVTVDEEGTALVSGRLLAEIVKSLPARPVELATDGAKAVLTCGSARFTLMLLPEDEYPSLPELPPLAGAVGADMLASAVGQVAIAAGRDDTLPALTGIRMEIAGDVVTLVATDRYRLAVRQLHWQPARPDLAAAVLVPAKVLVDTSRALVSAAEVSVALAAASNAAGSGGEGIIGLAGGGRQATSRLLGGEYPRYQSLLPDQFSAVAELPAATLIESVRRVALVAERGTAVRLTFASDTLTLEAGSGDEAQATETLDAVFDGDELRIAFNPHYLLDGLTAIDSDTARLSFTTPTRPAVITGKPDQDSEPDYRYVLMPIRGAV